MRRLLSVLIFVILISSVSSIRINEVEMNPINGGEGKEWIELYNDESEDINISGWEIWDGLKTSTKRYTIPNENIIKKEGFYVIELTNAILNNGGDFVILYDEEGEEIDRTETMKDSEWSVETWQLCDSWEFSEATKGEKNKCGEKEEEIPEEEDEDEETHEEESEDEEKEEEDTQKVIEVTGKTTESPESQSKEEIKPIILNPQNIKTGIDSEKESKNYAVYSFIAFSVLLAFLFLMKRKKYKNEFT